MRVVVDDPGRRKVIRIVAAREKKAHFHRPAIRRNAPRALGVHPDSLRAAVHPDLPNDTLLDIVRATSPPKLRPHRHPVLQLRCRVSGSDVPKHLLDVPLRQSLRGELPARPQ